MVQAETAPPESDQVVIWNGQVIGSDPDAAVLMVMDAPLSESFIDLLDGCAEEREFFKLPIVSPPLSWAPIQQRRSSATMLANGLSTSLRPTPITRIQSSRHFSC